MDSFRGKRALVVGLGKSGLCACRLLLQEGAKVSAVDERDDEALRSQMQPLAAQGADISLGALPKKALDEAELVVVSPGIPLSRPEFDGPRARGVPLIGEVELGYLCCKRPTRFIGVTGTNGKSTTTALTAELFQKAGQAVFAGGNLGTPLSESALSKQRYDVHVVELSSFQLEGADKLRMNGAALLNLTPDHQDRYKSFRDYGLAKAHIFKNQGAEDFAVVNADDSSVLSLAENAPAPLSAFSMSATVDSGRFVAFAQAAGNGFTLAGRRFEIDNRALRGAHNVQNAMAASLLAHLSGVAGNAIADGLQSYPGLPHRLESVGIFQGVEWVNDSKATNVESTLVALSAFAANVWLIAGGKGKGAPYAPVVRAAAGRVKGVLTIGQDAKAIEAAFSGTLPVHPCGNLADAVKLAQKLSRPDDVVLLSPACASYDQFQNFEDRGETFKRLVRSL